jgi:hypothetical protein
VSVYREKLKISKPYNNKMIPFLPLVWLVGIVVGLENTATSLEGMTCFSMYKVLNSYSSVSVNF